MSPGLRWKMRAIRCSSPCAAACSLVWGLIFAPPIFTFSVTGIGALGFSSITTVAPGATLSNPFPNGLNQPIGNTLGLLTNVGDTIHFVDQNRQAAYVQQYSLDIQRELPGGIAMTLGYTGSRGSRLQIGSINDSTLNINQLTADKLTRTDLTTKVANPFFGIVKTGSLSAATVEQRQLLRPFPQFGDIFVHQSNEGKSFYNSVTVKAVVPANSPVEQQLPVADKPMRHWQIAPVFPARFRAH